MLLLSLLACLCTRLCRAQADPSYTSTLWNTRAGLPDNSVQGITDAGNGQLLIATAGGLTLFDGLTFSSPPETVNLGSTNVTCCLARTADGTLWAGTEGSGLLAMHNGHSELFDQSNGLTDPFVRVIFEDSQRRLWVGTDGGLFLKQGDRFQRVRVANESNPQIVTLAEDQQHRILVGGTQLWRLEGRHSTTLRLPGRDNENQVKSVLFDKAGQLWVGTVGGLFQYRNGGFLRMPGPVNVVGLLQANDGSIWIGTVATGLFRYQGGTLRRLEKDGRYPIRIANILHQDADGRMWVGTQLGLIRLENTAARLTPLATQGNEFGTMATGFDQEPIFVARRALALDGDRSRPVVLPEHGQAQLLSVLYAKDHTVWLSTLGGGVYHQVPGRLEHYTTTTQPAIAGDYPRGLLETRDGALWIATGFGLSRIRNGQVANYDTEQGLPTRNIRTLLEDTAGCLWIGTETGPAQLCQDRFVSSIATEALRGEKIWAMLQDRAGSLWFGTREHGLYQFDGKALRHLTTTNGLPSNTIYTLLQDHDGTFWISSPEAIFSIREREMLSAGRSQDAHLNVTMYSVPGAGEGFQLARGRFPSGLVDSSNVVWFPSEKGVVHISNTPTVPPHAPLARITSIENDGLTVDTSHPVHVSANVRHLRIGFSAGYLGSLQAIETMYKMHGADSGWTYAGRPRTVEYQRLPPGTYRFEVRAFLRSNPDQQTTAVVDIVSEPPWYRTWWFLTLCCCTPFALAFLLHRLRLQALRSRFKVVLEERNRLAREMHDTVIQGCNGVSMLIEALASQSTSSKERVLLDLARTQMHTTISTARDAVWNLRNTQFDAVGDIVQALRLCAEQAQDVLGIEVRFSHTGAVPEVDASVAHEVIMIAREAIANAGKHSEASVIVMETGYTQGIFRLSVQDDGCGFLIEHKRRDDRHYGLLGMEERAAKITGLLTIHSAPGAGTRVDLKLLRLTAPADEQIEEIMA